MSNCICVDYGDFEPTVCHALTTPRARKSYFCCECGDVIAKGDVYECSTGLTDGSWWTEKTCARCANVAADFFNCARIHGSMVEEFEYAHGFDYRDGIPADFTPCGATA